MFNQSGEDRLASAAICSDLAQMDDRPWPEWRKGKPITTRQLARLLGAFRIKSKQLWIDGQNKHGYELLQFQDAFSRYIPPSETLEPLDTRDTAAFGDFPNARTDDGLADKNHPKALDTAGSSVLADRNGGYGDSTLFEGDSEEREAIKAVDGEAAICVHCGELVGLDEQHVPYNGDRKLHARCYDAHFGFERQGSP